jgi:hypothetical protein
MARRYQIDELIWLRESPLVTRPANLPPVEEWMGYGILATFIHVDMLYLFILLVLTDGIYVGRCLIVQLNETLATTITKRQVAGQVFSRPVTHLAIQTQVRRDSIKCSYASETEAISLA